VAASSQEKKVIKPIRQNPIIRFFKRKKFMNDYFEIIITMN